MPFDQFIIEQLAGDLLPDPTDDQLIATGFNRCHVTTNEGGSITEEVYVRNVVDRVVTTGTVFLGATFDCTRCHDHKYDPYTMKDFYSLFAYFNSIDGSPMDGNVKDHAPVLRVLTADQKTQLAQLEANRNKLQQERSALVAAAAGQYEEPADTALAKTTTQQETVWIDDDVPAGAKAEGGWQWAQAPLPVLSGQQASTRTATGLSQHFFTGASEPLVVDDDLVLFTSVYLDPETSATGDHAAVERRQLGSTGRIGAATKSTGARKARPAAGGWATCRRPANGCGWKCPRQTSGSSPAPRSTAGRSLSSMARSTGTRLARCNAAWLYHSLAAWEQDQRRLAARRCPSRCSRPCRWPLTSVTIDSSKTAARLLRGTCVCGQAARAPAAACECRADQAADRRYRAGGSHDTCLPGEAGAASGLCAGAWRIRSTRRGSDAAVASGVSATARRRAEQPTGSGSVVGRPGPSLDGARDGEPVLAAVLWRGAGEDRR